MIPFTIMGGSFYRVLIISHININKMVQFLLI